MISVREAREVLGGYGAQFSDGEVESMVRSLTGVATLALALDLGRLPDLPDHSVGANKMVSDPQPAMLGGPS